MSPLPDPSLHVRQKTPSTDLCYKSDISSLMVFTSPDSSLDRGRKPYIHPSNFIYTTLFVQKDKERCFAREKRVLNGKNKTLQSKRDWECSIYDDESPGYWGWDRLNKEVPTFWEISRFWWKLGLCARGDTLRETHTQFYFAVS